MSKAVKHRLCAEWLAFCLRIGWPKSDLDALQKIFWKFKGWETFKGWSAPPTKERADDDAR